MWLCCVYGSPLIHELGASGRNRVTEIKGQFAREVMNASLMAEGSCGAPCATVRMISSRNGIINSRKRV